MAYTPSLDDLPQAQGYTPSLNDIPQASQPSLDQRVGNALQQGGTATGLGIGNALGNITQTVGNLVKGNNPQNTWDAGDQLIGSALQHAGNYLSNATQQQFNQTNPGLTTKALYGLGQSAPMLPFYDLKDAATLGGLAQNIGAGAAQGYVNNPNAPISGALQGAGTTAAVSAIPIIGKGIGAGINYLKGGSLQDATNSLYQGLTNNLSQDQLNKNNVQGILDIYNQNKNDLGNQYSALKNTVANSGYATTQVKPIAGLDPANGLKYMQNSPETSTAIDNLVNKNTDVSSLNSLSKNLQQTLAKYQAAPTFDNAHDLQSQLGEEAGNYLSGIGLSNSDREAGNYLNGLRNNLKSDVQTTFANNGDQDLGNQLAQLSDNWKNQVIPFRNIPGIKSALNGKNFPANIVNSLKNDDEGGSNEAVRGMIAQNPQLSSGILAQSLKGATKKDPTGTGNYIVDPQKFIQGWSNLPDNIKNLAPQELNNGMQNIVNKANNLQTARSWVKHLGGWGVGLTAAHLLGLHEL